MQRSKVSQLSEEDKGWLDEELEKRGFSDYKELAELLKQRGYEISHASVHRYGQKLETRLSAIKASTEAAQMIAKAAPDSADDRSAAVAAMIQTGLFDALMDFQEASELPADERIIVLSKASQGFAKLFAANLLQKKWAEETKKRLDDLEKTCKAKKRWLDPETLKYIRESLYGG